MILMMNYCKVVLLNARLQTSLVDVHRTTTHVSTKVEIAFRSSRNEDCLQTDHRSIGWVFCGETCLHGFKSFTITDARIFLDFF